MALFDLLLRLVDLDGIQKIVAAVLVRITDGVDDISGCQAKIIKMLQEGTLDEKFKSDPIELLICLGYAALAVASKVYDHDHSPDVTSDGDVILSDRPLGTAQTDPELDFLVKLNSAAVGDAEVPLEAKAADGSQLSAIDFQRLLDTLIELLRYYLKEWIG